MSTNRKRRQRKAARHFQTDGYTYNQSSEPRKRTKPRIGLPHEVMALITEQHDRLRQGRQEHREGSSKAQPPKAQKSTVWRKSSVDQSFRHGTANRTRDVDARWGGTYLKVSRWSRRQCLAGKGLSKSMGRFKVVINGQARGGTDDPQFALGYVRAVKQVHGLAADVWDQGHSV